MWSGAWEIAKSVAATPLWQFVSLLVAAWFTQRIIFYRERTKRIEESQMQFYLSLVDEMAEMYRLALSSKTPEILQKLKDDQIAVMLKLSIMGSCEVMDAWGEFAKYLSSPSVDEARMTELASEVTLRMCREIHRER